MKALFALTDAIKNELDSNVLLNSVTYGDVDEIELLKSNRYPLAHVGISTGSISDSTSTINLSVIFISQTDETKEQESSFNDSELYVQNNMLACASRLVAVLKRGDLYAEGFQLEEDATVEFFSDRFTDKVAGVAIDMAVTIKNQVSVC
jgi:hypothetical protein